MTTAVQIASNIQRIIAAKGLIQKAVARNAGFTEQQFSDMLCGRKIIRAEHIPGIALSLGVSIEEIYGSDEKRI